jgi:hypothetical protein
MPTCGLIKSWQCSALIKHLHLCLAVDWYSYLRLETHVVANPGQIMLTKML